MILHAGNGLVLTQSKDIPMRERIFRSHVNLRDASEIAEWKEITEKQKEQMLAETAIIDVDNMTVDSIKRVDDIVSRVATRINDVPMSAEQSLGLVGYFPTWEIGKEMPIGYKVAYEGRLYEVIQAHTSQADWNPKVAISLFKAVSVEEDNIEWQQGMVLEKGKTYTDGGVTYKAIRDSGNPLYYNLSVLVGNYVEVV